MQLVCIAVLELEVAAEVDTVEVADMFGLVSGTVDSSVVVLLVYILLFLGMLRLAFHQRLLL